LFLCLLICSTILLIAKEVRKASSSTKSKSILRVQIQKFRNNLAKCGKNSKSKSEAFMSAREPGQDDDISDPEIVLTLELAIIPIHTQLVLIL
jgi:hypothetical protein